MLVVVAVVASTIAPNVMIIGDVVETLVAEPPASSIPPHKTPPNDKGGAGSGLSFLQATTVNNRIKVAIGNPLDILLTVSIV